MCFHNAEHDIWACVHACTKKKGKKRRRTSVHTHIHKYTHTSERLCESQNAEPEGCCVSDVCIVYSVVPVHVGDCCTLRPHSGLVLFTMTGVDSRLLSRRAERPSKERGGGVGGGRDRRRQKEIIDYTFFHLYLFTYCFSLFFGSSLIPSPQTSAPWVTSCQTARGGCRLSSYPLFSHFLPFGIHTVLHPGNHLGTLGNWTEATQMLISPWPPSDMHHTPPPPSRSLLPFFFFALLALSLWNLIEDSKVGVEVSWLSFYLMEEQRDGVADRGEGCISRLGVRASLWARRQVSWSSPHSALPPLPTIRLSVSITVGWLTVWINPCSSRHVLGPYQLGTGPWALMRKLVQGNWISYCVWDFIDCY